MEGIPSCVDCDRQGNQLRLRLKRCDLCYRDYVQIRFAKLEEEKGWQRRSLLIEGETKGAPSFARSSLVRCGKLHEKRETCVLCNKELEKDTQCWRIDASGNGSEEAVSTRVWCLECIPIPV